LQSPETLVLSSTAIGRAHLCILSGRLFSDIVGQDASTGPSHAMKKKKRYNEEKGDIDKGGRGVGGSFVDSF
jgi:hypothetical protein